MKPWREYVPKDPVENVKFRVRLLEACANDPVLRAGIKEICRRDWVFFTNAFLWQYNPKDTGQEMGPFITWDCQEEWAEATLKRLFTEQNDMLWEKSREMGATWLVLILCLWMCLFDKWKSFLFISHSEEAVEKSGKKNTLFWKVGVMLERLPNWLKGRVAKRKLSFNFLDTESSMEGGATTERSGVGGRNTAVILDEFSKHKQDFEILGQTADTGPRLFIGTHYGIGSAFYKLATELAMKKIVMHWLSHPAKAAGAYRYHKPTNRVEPLDPTYKYPEGFTFVTDGHPLGGPFPGLRSPWYDAEVLRRRNSRHVAMHLDINPKGSVHQFFDPLVMRDLADKHGRPPEWIGNLRYDKEGKPEDLRYDDEGPLRLWLLPRPDGKMPPGMYKIGADISQGQGTTLSCLSVINARTGEKVAEYGDSKIEPLDLAVYAVALARFFADQDGNGAELIWELPGPGQKFGDKVIELRYMRVFLHVDEMNLKKPVADRPGWTNNRQSMLDLLTDYRAALEEGDLVNPSKSALEECLNFKFTPEGWIEHGNFVSISDPRGARQNHGDQTVADALAWKLCRGKQARKKPEAQQEVPHGSLAWRRQFWESKKRERQSGWSQRR